MEKYLVLENWDGGSEYRFSNKKDAIAFAKKTCEWHTLDKG